jgi:2-(1,2-epoxy-1,2-dihydrophenyl)acetyl-CoA isomerase
MGIPQEWDTIGVEVADSIATVTLNRPDRMNVMNLTMRDELGTCFDALRLAVEKVRVVVITGAGDAFCAGGDVNDFDGTPAEELHDLMRLRSHRWFQGLWSLPQPTIAAVNGTAAGGGANLVLATDLAIASERARFGETFVRVGLMPDLGGLYLLPRLVGLRKAKELCFTGELIPAEQLAELGLVSRVVPHDELYPETMKLAQNLASKPRHTLALTKMVLNRATEQSMEEVLLNELLGQSYLFGTRDQRDALGTFLHRPERSTSDSEAVDGGR